MSDSFIVKKDEGRRFEFGNDSVVIMVSGKDTEDQYSLMNWTMARDGLARPHTHNKYEETFYVLRGTLEFLLHEDKIELSEGDFVRVPAGVRHGYVNRSGGPTETLVGFIPGGMEEFFYKYRTDEGAPRPLSRERFLAEAKAEHDTEYEVSG